MSLEGVVHTLVQAAVTEREEVQVQVYYQGPVLMAVEKIKWTAYWREKWQEVERSRIVGKIVGAH